MWQQVELNSEMAGLADGRVNNALYPIQCAAPQVLRSNSRVRGRRRLGEDTECDDNAARDRDTGLERCQLTCYTQ